MLLSIYGVCRERGYSISDAKMPTAGLNESCVTSYLTNLSKSYTPVLLLINNMQGRLTSLETLVTIARSIMAIKK